MVQMLALKGAANRDSLVPAAADEVTAHRAANRDSLVPAAADEVTAHRAQRPGATASVAADPPSAPGPGVVAAGTRGPRSRDSLPAGSQLGLCQREGGGAFSFGGPWARLRWPRPPDLRPPSPFLLPRAAPASPPRARAPSATDSLRQIPLRLEYLQLFLFPREKRTESSLKTGNGKLYLK